MPTEVLMQLLEAARAGSCDLHSAHHSPFCNSTYYTCLLAKYCKLLYSGGVFALALCMTRWRSCSAALVAIIHLQGQSRSGPSGRTPGGYVERV
jgi:hypothetical protein